MCVIPHDGRVASARTGKDTLTEKPVNAVWESTTPEEGCESRRYHLALCHDGV